MFKGIAFCLLLATTAAAQDVTGADRVNVVSLLEDGKIDRTGPGFLYDEHTLVCSYSDVKGALQLRIESQGASAFTNSLIVFNESMDVAVLRINEDVLSATPLGNLNSLAIGDPVTFWAEQNGEWRIAEGTVREITDTGKGYDLISVDSAVFSPHGSPLYNTKKQVVGWIQGQSAVPLGRIAQLAERKSESLTIRQYKGSSTVWKFQKPAIPLNNTTPDVREMITLRGPSAYPFRIDLPHAWKTRAYKPSSNFLLRTEDPQSGICAELRATRLGDRDLLTGIDKTEPLVFTNLLRSQMVPYSTTHFTGFRAQYEDSDSVRLYAVDVFYTAFSGNLYILSVAYPQNVQSDITELIEQIFSSLRL